MKRPERVAAVDKIEEKRKPEDFIGHRNSKTDCFIRHPSSPTGGAKGKTANLVDWQSFFAVFAIRNK